MEINQSSSPLPPLPPLPLLRLGTRGSLLARTQSGMILQQLQSLSKYQASEVIIQSEGDDLSIVLGKNARPGVFVTALRQALLKGEVDFLVHSYKDLPSLPFPGITMAAIPAREDYRDVLVSRSGLSLLQLPAGSKIGTSSPRRAARITYLRPDLRVLPIRGNIDSRLQKILSGEFDAGVLAAAGLNRVGKSQEICEYFTTEQMLPAPAQGALAVECRSEDSELVKELSALNDPLTELTTTAERAILIGIGATCATAIGALAQLEGEILTLTAELSEESSNEHIRFSRSLSITGLGDLAAAQELGAQVAALIKLSPLGKRLTSNYE